MKKVLSLIAACLLLVGMVGFSVSAATPKEDIIAAAKEAMPDAYESKYMPTIENVLSQIDVTAEQAEAVIANIGEAKAAIKEDKGDSLSEYSGVEIDAVLTEFDAACTTLGLKYEFVEAENPAQVGDNVVNIYKADGALIGSIDGDGVKKTNASEQNGVAVIVLVSALALAASAAVFGKKIAAR